MPNATTPSPHTAPTAVLTPALLPSPAPGGAAVALAVWIVVAGTVTVGEEVGIVVAEALGVRDCKVRQCCTRKECGRRRTFAITVGREASGIGQRRWEEKRTCGEKTVDRPCGVIRVVPEVLGHLFVRVSSSEGREERMGHAQAMGRKGAR